MDGKLIEKIRDFYRGADIWVPERMKFRGFTFRFPDGRVRKIRRKMWIHELRRLCVKLAPIDCYVTATEWVSPDMFQGYEMHWKGYEWMYNVMLKSDFVVDIDSKAIGSMDDSYKMLVRVHGFLKRSGYDDFLFSRTGKGFHLWVLDWWKKNHDRDIADLRERVSYYQGKKVVLVKAMHKAGLVFDEPCSIDMTRVVRVFGSLHRNGSIISVSDDVNDNCIVNAHVVPFYKELDQATSSLALPRVSRGMMNGRHFAESGSLGGHGPPQPHLVS